jgi:hypothetical protein
MSIIFEALKKIEEEKREDPLGGPPVVLSLPGEKSSTEPRRISAARIITVAAAVGIPLIFLSALYLRHRMPGNTARPPAEPPPGRAGHTTSTKPVMEEVRLKPRSILSTVEGFSPETLQPASPPSPAAAPPAAATPPPAAQLPALHLRGLSRSGSRSWAFINDRMLKVGDTVEGAEVVEILSDRVKLRNGGTVFTLTY